MWSINVNQMHLRATIDFVRGEGDAQLFSCPAKLQGWGCVVDVVVFFFGLWQNVQIFHNTKNPMIKTHATNFQPMMVSQSCPVTYAIIQFWLAGQVTKTVPDPKVFWGDTWKQSTGDSSQKRRLAQFVVNVIRCLQASIIWSITWRLTWRTICKKEFE